MRPIDVSVVVVSFNTRGLLRRCLANVNQQIEGLRAEVLVVDNASRDGSAQMVRDEFPQVQLIANEANRGFAAANNQAFARARGRLVALLNPDAELGDGVLRRAVARMNREPRVAAVGGRLLASDGTPQPSARMFPTLRDEVFVRTGLAWKFRRSRIFGRLDRAWADPDVDARVDWVPGAFFLVRASLLQRLGGFDERFFLYYEEVDLCRRIAAAGGEIWYWADCAVRHVGGASSADAPAEQRSTSGSQLELWSQRSAYLYYRKHHGLRGVVGAHAIALAWSTLRMWRNRLAADPQRAANRWRARVSRAAAVRAWRETRGGRVCPTRPWVLEGVE